VQNVELTNMNEKQKRKVLNELNRMSAKVGLFCYKDYEENVENGVADSCPCPECKNDRA